MKILAVELSSTQRSVAVIDLAEGPVIAGPLAGRVLGEARESGLKSMQALGMVEQALQQACLDRSAIQGLTVGLGPGSYTGVRAGLALAQGWQLACAVKVRGVGSFPGLAAGAYLEGWRGPVSFVIDAQRNEFYQTIYDIAETGWRETQTLRLVGVGEIQRLRQEGLRVAGPDLGRWFPFATTVHPLASVMGRMTLACREPELGCALEPIYPRETAYVKAPPPRIIPDS